MASLNKCFFIGNLTKDPECRYMTNGEAVTNVSIACNETWKDKSGEKKESVEYVNLVFYKKLAEIAGEYCKKGSSIHVEGKMKTRKWQDKEGQDRYTTEIIANEMQILSRKSDGSGEVADKPADSSGAPEPRKSAPAKGAFDNYDDDIPFNRAGSCGLWRVM